MKTYEKPESVKHDSVAKISGSVGDYYYNYSGYSYTYSGYNYNYGYYSTCYVSYYYGYYNSCY